MRGRANDELQFGPAVGPTRRQLIAGALGATLLWELADLTGDPAAAAGAPGAPELLPFVDEGSEWRAALALATGEADEPHRYGSGLGGRQIFDLSTLERRHLGVPTERFFVRTFRPDELAKRVDGSLTVGGDLSRPRAIPLAEIRRRARNRGVHVVECSGNGPEHDFGLIGCAAWEGVEALELLTESRPRAAMAVEIAGYDEHRMPSLGSEQGASWIFTREQLEASGAFFATAMNGRPLTRDHGAPMRLVVPGWYGCASIKWVTQARWVDGEAPSTSQMREFAGRTHQRGVPERALDFEPATIDPAAMPVRVELRRTPRGRELRLDGIAWGGPERVRRLAIQCGAEAPWAAVHQLSPAKEGTPWRFWSHASTLPGSAAIPKLPIRLRVTEPAVRTRRLDRGYYTRRVAVPEA